MVICKQNHSAFFWFAYKHTGNDRSPTTHFEQLGWLERPFHLTAQAVDVDPTGYVDASRQLTDVLVEGNHFKCHMVHTQRV